MYNIKFVFASIFSSFCCHFYNNIVFSYNESMYCIIVQNKQHILQQYKRFYFLSKRTLNIFFRFTILDNYTRSHRCTLRATYIHWKNCVIKDTDPRSFFNTDFDIFLGVHIKNAHYCMRITTHCSFHIFYNDNFLFTVAVKNTQNML